jgi:hypothetical protein
MADRPDTMLEWATVADADYPGRLEPNAGKKAVGYDDGEKPPAGEHNWLFGLAGDWLAYLDGVAQTFLDIASDIALKSLANAFEAGQRITPATANDPLIATTYQPGSAKWTPAFEFAASATTTCRLYWGSDVALGFAIVTYNAAWNPGTLVWTAEDTSKASGALILKLNGGTTQLGVAVSHREPGAGTWSAWPKTAGNVSSGGDFTYEQVRVRQQQVNVLAFVPLSGTWTVGAVSGAPEAGGASDEMCIPLRLPHGMYVDRVHVLHAQTSSAANEFDVLARRKTDWPAPGAITPPATALPSHGPSEVRATITGPSSSGTHYSTSSGGGFTVDNYSESYVLHVIAGAAGNALPLAVMIEFEDTGPINM